jgi:serine O-acetyltransferase
MLCLRRAAVRVLNYAPMLKELRRDSEKYAADGSWYSQPGFWIVAIYRFGVWADPLPRGLRLPCRVVYRIARAVVRIVFNVDVWAGSKGAHIGAGLRLIHPSNIIIEGGVEIGEDCLIFHEVTLGSGPVPGAPRIGNGVDIYAGARVLGGIRVGDHCMIGANCVVTTDIPARTIVMPAPNLKLPRSLSPVASGGGPKSSTSSS